MKSKIKLIALVLTLILSSSAIGYWVKAQTELSFTTIIENGAMVQTYSYIIFEDGSNYYAKNGTTGAIDYSGIVAETVIQWAIDETEPSGDWTTDNAWIYCKGKIVITAPINITNRHKLTFQFEDISVYGNVNGINVIGGYDCEGVRIIGGALHGGGIGNTLLYIQACYVDVDIGLIQGDVSVGVAILGGGDGSYYNMIKVGRILGAETGVLFYVVNSPETIRYNNVKIGQIGATPSKRTFGVKFMRAGTGWISDNIVEALYQFAHVDDWGFYSDASDGVVTKMGNTLFHCVTSDGILSGQKPIYVTSTGILTIIGGEFEDWTKIDIDGIVYWQQVSFYEQGMTENHGSNVFSASSSDTFDHGLCGTPTFVSVSFYNGTLAEYGSWSYSATSTQITVRVNNTGSWTYTWYAECHL